MIVGGFDSPDSVLIPIHQFYKPFECLRRRSGAYTGVRVSIEVRLYPYETNHLLKSNKRMLYEICSGQPIRISIRVKPDSTPQASKISTHLGKYQNGR